MSDRPDPWERLRQLTPARIGLGRTGDALPTRALLDFQLAHARARDAVRAELDVPRLRRELATALPDWPSVAVSSCAADRDLYLQRPDLGGKLHPEDAGELRAGAFDAVFILADGLSATAVHAHALAVLAGVASRLGSLALAPLVIARQARVALGDPIGAALGARLSVILIGERPGLSSPDSLGAYLTFAPQAGRTDAERNCISNIRRGGLPPGAAAERLAGLVLDSLRLRISGVALKDRSEPTLVGETPPTLE
ncbi:MAG: ethanolamine ammonia-lyase subunit EutC [Myxococcales bacterium]|nr:ethanolamine ammonia-lyase subunit EutC [Myxococcales bacterium]